MILSQILHNLYAQNQDKKKQPTNFKKSDSHFEL